MPTHLSTANDISPVGSTGPLRAEVAESRQRGNPRPRLDVFGYTVLAGSPTCTEVRLVGDARWRRVYVWQFSNAGTCFVRVRGEPVIVSF